MSAPKHDTWMPLFVGSYLRDTRRLSTAQHGAYLLLIMEAWTHDGLIPDDDASLARIAGMSTREWKASKSVVMGFWTACEGGFRQKKVDEEIARAKANIEQKSEAGRASAAQRALQRKGNGRSTGVATDEPTEPQRNGRPSPSPCSVPNGTGAAAPIDAEKKAWQDGVDLLCSAGKMSNPNARSFLGKLKAEHGIEAKDLLPAIGQAIASGTQDPAAYLRRAAEGVGKRRGGGSAAPPDADEPINWQIRADLWRKQGTWLGAWGPTPRERKCQCPPELLEAR